MPLLYECIRCQPNFPNQRGFSWLYSCEWSLQSPSNYHDLKQNLKFSTLWKGISLDPTSILVSSCLESLLIINAFLFHFFLYIPHSINSLIIISTMLSTYVGFPLSSLHLISAFMSKECDKDHSHSFSIIPWLIRLIFIMIIFFVLLKISSLDQCFNLIL